MGRGTQETQSGGEVVRGMHGEVAFVAKYPPSPDESVLADVSSCLNLTERAQVIGEATSAAHGPDVVFVEYLPRSGEGVLI
jgi:hypothetical protein